MELVWSIVFLLSFSQLTFGSENVQEATSSHLSKRNIIPRSSSRGSQRIDGSSEVDPDVLPGRVVYQVNEDLPSLYGTSLSFENLPSDTLNPETFGRSDVEEANQRYYPDEVTPFLYGDKLQQPNLSKKWQSFGNDLYSYDNTNSNLIRNNNNNKSSEGDVLTHLDDEEGLMLQKRMQMKGMGLLGAMGSNKGAVGQQSLTGMSGMSKSRPKGLVLSIDLGIKALRDAIMHAKFQQKNKQHQMQAQKNMRLLHNIGKRRAQYLTQGRL